MTLPQRAVLFDLDGTLVDLREIHELALNAALRSVGWPEIAHDEHLARFDGLPTRVKLDMLAVPDDLRFAINERKQRKTLMEIHRQCRPDERLLGELAGLADVGVFIGIVSNACTASCHAMLFRSGIARYCKLLLTGDMGKPKPDPDLYTKALTVLGYPPAVIAVEDNGHGVDAAQQAGLYCMRVRGPNDITCAKVTGAIDALGRGRLS